MEQKEAPEQSRLEKLHESGEALESAAKLAGTRKQLLAIASQFVKKITRQWKLQNRFSATSKCATLSASSATNFEESAGKVGNRPSQAQPAGRVESKESLKPRMDSVWEGENPQPPVATINKKSTPNH